MCKEAPTSSKDLETGESEASCTDYSNAPGSQGNGDSSSGLNGGFAVVKAHGNGSVRTTIGLILFLGAATSAAFLWFGVSTANQEKELEFTRVAADTTSKIAAAFEDYVVATNTIHLRCRHRNFTRQDFRETYEYIVSSGLQFKAAQFDPMIPHEDREAAEAEARAYYAEHYPHVDYQGIRGFNYANSTSLEPRIEQPFYFPIHYQEPIEGNEAAIDLDYYSSESRKRAVDAVFSTKGPSLTDRLSLVKKKGEVSRCGNHNGPSFGVVLMHPGVELSEPQATDEVWPKDFSSIVLCVPDLLRRSTMTQTKASRIYIHDRSTPGEDAVFMGGALVAIDPTMDPVATIDYKDEIPFDELSADLKQQSNVTAANRIWTVTVMSVGDEYEADIVFVCLGGAIIFAASFCLAIWIWSAARHAEQYNHVVDAAERSNAIVTSLFPKNVAKQIMEHNENEKNEKGTDLKSKPIADLFPETTVMFADLEGFTAWASMRDPISVFHLLETLYGGFDEIAARRNVFKVETVGDSYVAVCGLPERNKNHASVMARFAQDCAEKASQTTKRLEVELGPETSLLGFRFGLHSGPVTGGVLRGQRARFQIFGDTVNTASRIEHTSKKGRIQISMSTANLLRAAGKGNWVVPREERVLAKGIGVIQTCWLSLKSQSQGQVAVMEDVSQNINMTSEGNQDSLSKSKKATLVDWHTEGLARFLKVVVAQQQASGVSKDAEKKLSSAESKMVKHRKAPIDEITERIPFPKIQQNLAEVEEAAEAVELSEEVMRQLRSFVYTIAGTYKDVPFHNFDHASHVVMCVMKLLGSASNHRDNGLDDPLARFSLVLAAIVHDAAHEGVPNAQLNKEADDIASTYNFKSVAEQNSLDIAWGLLMRDEYKDLRRTIYTRKEDLERFRALMVHTVLVTDIVNKDLQSQRKIRWNRVFGTDDDNKEETAPPLYQTEEERQSERRTALLELVIQASDVSHTMQHWHIYRQWNSCLFHEMDKAWKEGRADKDPREDWFKGEIGFFKFYILPLAERVKHSSAFGALGAELYQSAESNLIEWEMKGNDVVQELIEEAKVKAGGAEKPDSIQSTSGGEIIAVLATDVDC